MNFWVNERWWQNPGGVDNDTKSISSVQMGILSPSSAGISGSVYFDDFASNNSGYIGHDFNVTLPDYTQFLADGFKSGDMSAWSNAETDDGNLSVTTGAAIEGTYGLQGTVDGQNAMYVEDDRPTSERYYHARFYFDPDSVAIPAGDYIDIFKGSGMGGTAFTIRLGRVSGDYAIKVVMWDDSNTTTESDWTSIENNANCIEVLWAQAGSDTGHDGYWTLRVNGNQVEEADNLSNFTKTISFAQMGILSLSSGDISGTVNLTTFESKSGDYIGLDPNVTLPDYSQFLTDGFESGDTSAWSSAETDSSNLSVTTDAAIVGDYGLQGAVDGQNEMYVEDDSPAGEHYYHARFYFDPNSVNIAEGDTLDIFRGDGIGGEAFSVRLGWVNGGYAVKVVMVADDSSTTAWIGNRSTMPRTASRSNGDAPGRIPVLMDI